MTLLALLTAAFLTSCLTAVLGLGGGVLLLLVMPGLLPLSAILPVHAVVQTASNTARAAFFWHEIAWYIVPPLLLGSVIGAAVGGQVVGLINLSLLPAVSGLLILLVTWLPGLVPARGGRFALIALGFYQTALGMLAGATGPLGAAVLARLGRGKDWVVVNTGVYMALNHLVRSVAYALLGFAFAPWWPVMLAMAVATILGAWLGGRIRQSVPDRNFHRIFRWLITVLALRMIAFTIIEVSDTIPWQFAE